MNHKDEAEETLGQVHIWASEEADLDKVVDLLYMQANIACAQAEATLALVDALEAANEQARIANLIALAGSEINDVIGDPSFDPAAEALLTLVNSFPIAMDDEAYGFAPDIAAALGIGGNE